MKLLVLLAFLLVPFAADARHRHRRHRHEAPIKAEKTLYERMGGKKTLEAVVDDFAKRCSQDARVSSFYASVASNPSHLSKYKSRLNEQLCEAAGGPCHGGGHAVAKNDLDDERFYAVAESFSDALDARHVPEREKNEALAAFGGLRQQIASANP